MSILMRKNPVFKAVSVLLICTFLSYNTGFAVPETNIAPPNISDTTGVLDVENIGIAIDAGEIKSKYAGDADKTIIHIQDAHCNFEAQSNINKILAQVTKECGIDMISVEGAEGIVDTAWFRAFPDEEIRKEVATYFMKKGEITGAEFFSIISDYKGTIFGAETREYYIKNLKAFTDVYPYKDAIEEYFTNINKVANRIKSIIYSPKLKKLDSKIHAFESKEIELSEYAAYLEKISRSMKVDLKGYVSFSKLLQTLEYEDKIDFDIVDAERSKYIDVLGKKLSKKEMTELVAQSIRFKKGHIKAVEFYLYLRELAKEQDIPMVREYPNLFYYYIYTKLYDGINNEGLFKEISALEQKLKEKLFQDETQRKLDKYSETLNMFINLVDIELTNEDYDLFKEYSNEFSLEDVVEFVRMLSSRYNLNYDTYSIPADVLENIPNMITFYEIAMRRDEALIDNTLKRMDAEGKSQCVLIAGGFHTRGIKDLLEKKGVSYLVVTPKITKDVETPYIKVLTNQRTSLEDIITENAMPGTARTDVDVEFLAPLARVGFLADLYLKDPAELKTLSDEIGKVEGSLTTEDTTVETVNEIVQALVDANVAKWQASPAWEDAEGKMDEVIPAFIQVCEIAYTRIEGRPLPQKVSDAIKRAFGSVGENAMAGTAGEPLTREQYTLYDELLRESFSEEGTEKGWVKEDIRTRAGLIVQIHEGIEERRAEKNDERLQAGEAPIPSVRVHPSTYLGRRQMHVSGLYWPRLTEEEKNIISNHERAHIRIAEGRGAVYNLWRQYQEYAKEEKIPEDQEDFVDRINYWSERFEGPADFQNCDTREIRKKVTKIYEEWVINQAQQAIKNKNEKGIRIALIEAYELASEDKEFGALVEIINSLAENIDDSREELYKNVIYQIAEWVPFWLTTSYCDGAETKAKDLLKAWFNGSKFDQEVSTKNVVSVIMAGGSGERLVPLSTSGTAESEPKQVTKIIDKRLIVMAVERVIKELGAENVYIQTVPHMKDTIYGVLKDVKDLKGQRISKDNIFAEPYAADTAAAIGFAAAKLTRLGRGNDVMFVQTADHYIETESGRFKKAYMSAAAVAKNNPVMGLLGIEMKKPSSAYGCIRVGGNTQYDGVVVVDQFKEKPSIEVATQMIKEGKTRYNSGMFIMRPEVVLGFFEEKAPDYGEGLRLLAQPDVTDATEKAVFKSMAQWKKDKKTPNGYVAGSVDNVLAEFMGDRLFMVTGDFAWKDVGGYESIMEYYREDYSGETVYAKNKNIVIGEGFEDEYETRMIEGSTNNVVVANNPNNVILEKCENCLVLVRDEKVKVRVSGLKDSLVVYNPHTKALLVAPIDVEGSSVKDKFVKVIAEKPELKGYTTGRLEDITTADKKAVLSKIDTVNKTVLYQYGKGAGLIEGSRDSQVSVGIGLAAILDMKTQSVLIDMRPSSADPDIPEIFVSTREGTVRVPSEVVIGIKQLTPEERMKDVIDMVLSEEQSIPDAGTYARLYEIDNETAKKEIETITARIERYEHFINTVMLPKFGTSGLRGRNEDLKDMIVKIVMVGVIRYFEDLHERSVDEIPSAFLDFIKEGSMEKGAPITLAGDNRPYTDKMLLASAVGILANGNTVDYIGKVPTPTAALYGLMREIVMAMVTGSHIPISENGMKFDRVNGEIWKEEEGSLLSYVRAAMKEEFLKSPEESQFQLSKDSKLNGKFKDLKDMSAEQAGIFNAAAEAIEQANPEAVEMYEKRFLEALGKSLKGEEFLFWQHTAVGREILPDILEKMEATVKRVGLRNAANESEFMTVDTENVKQVYLDDAQALLIEHNKELLLTTDGDSDRPAVFYLTDIVRSENGKIINGNINFITGDKLGVLAAAFLQPEFFVVPDTANESALKFLTDQGVAVQTTDVGSPFVDEAIYSHNKGKQAVGCENNGGFFIGASGFQLSKERMNWLKSLNPENSVITGYFSGLSTRDALSPMVFMLLLSKLEGKSVENLVEDTFSGEYAGEQVAGLVEHTDTNMTPGCEAYIREMNALIIDQYRVYDEERTRYAEEIEFGAREIKYRYKKDKDFVEDNGRMYRDAVNIQAGLEKYLNDTDVFNDVTITRLTYKTSGVKLYLKNKEIIVLRPSGNSAQFRIMATTLTKTRSEEIVAAGIADNSGILIKIIQDFAKDFSTEEEVEPFVPAATRVTPGRYSISPGQTSPQPQTEKLIKRAEASRFYKEAVNKKDFIRAIRKLDEHIKSGGQITQKIYLRLGIDNYNWGQELSKSSILALQGATEEIEDKVKIVKNNLTEGQIDKFRAKHRESGSDLDFDLWLDKILEKEYVAERWFSAGGIITKIGEEEYILPVEVLELWPEEVFGMDHVAEFGAQNLITSKHLDSRQPLSAQMHKFTEMITIRDEGTAYIGLGNDVTPQEIEKTVMNGTMIGLMNKKTFTKDDIGKTYMVPAYTIHAYGDVDVDEVKAVTPAEDKVGTISFFDRLKFYETPDQKKADTKEGLKALNKGRENKDMLTMDGESLEKTRGWLQEAYEAEALKGISPDQLEIEPVKIEGTDKANFTLMGIVPGKFATGNYNLEKNESLEAPDMLKERLHTLVVYEGKVNIKTSDGKVIKLFKGNELLWYRNMGAYRIEAVEGPAMVSAKVMPLPKSDNRIIVGQGKKTVLADLTEGKEDVRDHTEGVTIQTYDNGLTTARDDLQIVSDRPVDVPGILENREHSITVIKGNVYLQFAAGPTFISIDLSKGNTYPISEDMGEYTIVKRGIEPAKVAFSYEKHPGEDVFYTAYKVLKDNIATIKEEAKKVDLILPDMYFANDGVGSKKWVEKQLNGIFGKSAEGEKFVRISTHQDSVQGLSDLGRVKIRPGAIAILGATGEAFKAINKDDAALNAFLEKVRPMALPTIGENYVEKANNMLPMLISSIGLLQAAISVDNISSRENIALDVLRVMARAMNRPDLKPEDLYNILSNIEVKGLDREALDKIEEQWGGLSVQNQTAYVLNYFGLKDIAPEDPREEWQNRQKVMWSV